MCLQLAVNMSHSVKSDWRIWTGKLYFQTGGLAAVNVSMDDHEDTRVSWGRNTWSCLGDQRDGRKPSRATCHCTLYLANKFFSLSPKICISFWKLVPKFELKGFSAFRHGMSNVAGAASSIRPSQVYDTERPPLFAKHWPRHWACLRQTRLILANVAVARPSVVSLSVWRLSLSSVTFMRPTQAVQIFGNISWPSIDIHWKFCGDRPRGTPPPGELNTRGVATYSDFGPIDGYISETVQDRR